MIGRRAALLPAACTAAVAGLWAAPAAAWESPCYSYADVSLEPSAYASLPSTRCDPIAGPNTARQRWIGKLDEHRTLFERSRELAGIPASVGGTLSLRVFTGGGGITIGGSPAPSLIPAPFAEATRAHTRYTSVPELAHLPDYSFALWDWASGHETCPLDESSAEVCHDFGSHMGPVNSNHFVPQAHAFYVRYHDLALARAADCKAMQEKLAAAGGRFDAYVLECEREALALESIAAHYLHDAWSVGHTWQRWGSPNLTDFPADEQRDRAVLVALASGLIHGAHGVLQALPTWTTYDVNDAMCAPHDAVRLKTRDGELIPAVGDDYLAMLPVGLAQGGPYAEQARRLYSCAAASVLQVYQATGQLHGPLGTPAAGLSSYDPRGQDCFGQRATNRSMLAGAALQFKIAGQQVTIELDSRLASWLVPKVARSQGDVPVSPRLRNQFRFGLQRIVSMTRLLAAVDPDGTGAAEGRVGELLGAGPNGDYYGSPAGYADPALPWPGASADATERERAAQLARVFHRAHAADWCAALGAAELDALKAHAADATLDAEGRAAACEVCKVFAGRHLRIGTAADWDTAGEPLCHYLATAPAYIYQPGPGSADELAAAWCGCQQP